MGTLLTIEGEGLKIGEIHDKVGWNMLRKKCELGQSQHKNEGIRFLFLA